MSTRIPTRIFRALCALLLLAVVVALVPTQRAAADEQNVKLTNKQVKQAIWNANWSQTPFGTSSLIELMIKTELFYKAAPNPGDSIALGDHMKEFERRYLERLGPGGSDPQYRDKLPPDQIVRAMFDAADSMPVFQAVATDVWLDLLHSEKGNTPIYDALSNYSFPDILQEHQGELQAATLERAKQDPQFAGVFDKVFSQGLGVSIKDFVADTFDSRKFIDDHPGLSIPQRIRDGILPDGTLSISLTDLKSLATTQYGNVNTSIDDVQRTLVTLDAQQKDLLKFMQDQQARQAAEALAKAKAQEHQLKIQAADSAISIISTLAGFVDPKVGKQIATVGRSALQIYQSINTWLGAVAGLNTLDKVFSLSTVVMTGNVLSAVMNFVSLFGSSQPTPDQLILQEIGKLRQQVDQLRTEMHDRFDRVDKELNTIYTTMQDRFDKIDVQLGKITTSLDEIQQTLDKLSLDLSRLEHNNFEFLDALGRRPLRDAINGAIGYKQRTGVDMPYQPDFVGYENTFQTWGTINAFDALSAGPTQRDYSDGQVLAELNAYPLDANLNYLNGWLQAHGMTPFASKRLASPRDWAFAGRAYADIGFDWPQHMRRIDPQRQVALDAVGNDLETALHGISTIDTPNGPQGNAPLFDGVMAYYTAKLGAVDTALQSSQSAYVQEVQGRLQRSQPFDLFGGLDQPLTYQPADFASMSCGGTANGVATPGNLKNIVPSYNRAALADYMGVSKLTACLTADWVDEIPDCYIPPGETLPVCDTYATAQATITVYDNGVALASSSAKNNIGVNISGTTPMIEVVNAWGIYQSQFEAQFASAAAGTTELGAITGGLQNQLRGYQQEFFGRVVNGLTNGGLHPAGVELAGAKKLLDSFVTLGFSQATNNDDFLRSLLFSDQQLSDDQQIIATYAASISAASSDTQLTTNPRLTVSDTAQKRRDALSGLLKRYLDGISAQTYREDSALVADTRLDLRLARGFADTGSPSSPDQPTPSPTQPTQPTLPGKNKVIFLPVVVR